MKIKLFFYAIFITTAQQIGAFAGTGKPITLGQWYCIGPIKDA
jgi:hypothetical protein